MYWLRVLEDSRFFRCAGSVVAAAVLVGIVYHGGRTLIGVLF